VIGARQAECGFDIWQRDDGLWAEGPDGFYDENRSPYNEYLKSKGYPGENPWADFANAGVEGNDIASGWFMTNANKPANIKEEDSETPWLTSEAIKFIEQAEGPWCAHLSYIKPHWPYIVPAPYHDMFGPEHVPAPLRDERERVDPHPVYSAFMNNRVGQAFSRDEVRDKVIPAYMGLIKQCDDQMGRLFDYLETTGQMDNTMIVTTSDHGDYLGDHWLGEKDLFHEQSVKVPLIVYDPSPDANATRGTTCDALVESIDLPATFVEVAGGTVPGHIIEGRSLLPFLHGTTPKKWREYAVSEYDYSTSPMAAHLGVSNRDARLFMVTNYHWKFIHAEGGFRPMLFDLQADPNEYNDLGNSADHTEIISQMYGHLHQWSRRMSQRVTKSDAEIDAGKANPMDVGIIVGVYDESEIDPAFVVAYHSKSPSRKE
jgi:arylsulfatase A-like enzyme